MNHIELSLLISLAALFAFQVFYWSFFMFRVRRASAAPAANIPVSVVVCAKNEARNLQRLIPQLFAQRYPRFQVVVVNDCSDDDTLMVLAQLKSQYPAFYYTSIPADNKFSHGKKLAITIGIKAAEHEHIVFTDADCVPASDMWLANIMQAYEPGKQMVLGYGRYAKEGGFLNFFIRYETFWSAVQYCGYARAWRPFMGVGRNMSYTKALYNQSSKFRNNWHIMSGDDDMFVSEMGTRANTAVCFAPEAHTVSEPKHTWADWVEQKSRHFATAPLYRKGIKAMLVAENITRQLFYATAIAVAVLGNQYLLIGSLAAVAARWILIYVSLGIASKRMGERGLWAWAAPMDIIVPWLQLGVMARSYLSKRNDVWR